jgi:hypothetical protein
MRVAIVSASILASIGAPADAHVAKSISPRAGAAVKLPKPASARLIVKNLWSRREVALATLREARLVPIERASARRFDSNYVRNVRCKCEPKKDRHPAIAVIVQVPRRSVKPVFFAQVRTTNAVRKHPWYVIAVERAAGTWRIALVVFGGYGAAPPLRGLTRSNAKTLPVKARSYARIRRLADASLAYRTAHAKRRNRTSYGATVRIRSEMQRAKDGIYGLALPGGKVISCFTMHSIKTYSLPRGLAQNARRKQWGHGLAPGSYKTITVDRAVPMCTVGKGARRAIGVLRFTYNERAVGITGVRRASRP